MQDVAAATAPRSRLLGYLYLAYFFVAISGNYHYAFFRWEVLPAAGTHVLADILYLVLTVLLYEVFRGVNRRLALLMLCLGVAGCTVQILGEIFLISVSSIGIIPSSAYVITTWAAALTNEANSNAQALFGVFDVLLGVLIWRSRLLPRMLGVPMALAGLRVLYLSPLLTQKTGHVLESLQVYPELLLMIWLLVRGIDETRRSTQEDPS